MRHIYPRGGVASETGGLLFANTRMGVTRRCRKEVGGKVTNYSSLSVILFLKGSIPKESRGEEGRLEAREFFSPIHHKAAATILTTSFLLENHFALPAQTFTNDPSSPARRRSFPSLRNNRQIASSFLLILDEIKFESNRSAYLYKFPSPDRRK